MEIKGTAIKSIYNFVKQKHSDKFDEWLNSLPPESKTIYSNPILATDWYSLLEAGSIPTSYIGKVCYGSEKKGAWEAGRYSAESALTGIYKVFIKLSTPNYIIDRASKIFSTYYRPSKMEIANRIDKGVSLHITEFPEPDKISEYRIAGWIEKALQLNNCKNVTVNITRSLTTGSSYTQFDMKWD